MKPGKSGNEASPIPKIHKNFCSWISKAVANNVHLKIEKKLQPGDCYKFLIRNYDQVKELKVSLFNMKILSTLVLKFLNLFLIF